MDADKVFVTNDKVDTVVDRIDEMRGEQLRHHCRMLEMIGQQQMHRIRELEKEADRLAEEKDAIDVELAVEIEGREAIEKRMEEMAASEKLAIEEVDRFLLSKGLPKTKGVCIQDSYRSVLKAFKHVIDSLDDDEAKLNREIAAFESDRSRDASEHRAIMFALISFGILMVALTVGIVWTAVA